jgi:hypothetical protein
MMNNGKTESNEANQKAEDLNEGIRTGSEKLAGFERGCH